MPNYDNSIPNRDNPTHFSNKQSFLVLLDGFIKTHDDRLFKQDFYNPNVYYEICKRTSDNIKEQEQNA